jgi:hypothetical protein
MTTQPSAQRSRPRRTRRTGAIGRAGHVAMVLALLASTLAVDATLRPGRAEASATTCTTTNSTVTVGSTIYQVREFRTVGACTWQIPARLTSVEYLIVAGGGGGSNGGGGGGQVRIGTLSISGGTTSTVVTVGAGGSGQSSLNTRGNNGGDSSAFSATALGGGGGGSVAASTATGASGGSGGGAGDPYQLGQETPVLVAGGAGVLGRSSTAGNGGSTNANTGSRPGGGGGGATQNGESTSGATVGGKGGDGRPSSITGSEKFYGGGGGGGVYMNDGTAGGQGGTGGGGRGGASGGMTPTSGSTNTGGGGGGARGTGSGANGGSGIVILRYEEPIPPTDLVLTTPAPTGAQSGVSLSPGPVLELRASNQTVAGATDTVTAAIASGPDGAQLSGDVVDAVAGVATFGGLAINGPIGDYTIEFTSEDLSVVSGTITLTVGPASAATSVITAEPPSVPADGTSTSNVTVQLKDSGGNNLTSSGGTVALGTNLGTLSGVTDVENGSYTAVLTSSVSGTATITGTLGDDAISGSATVEFTSLSQGALAVTSTLATYDGKYELALTVSGGSGEGAVSFTVVAGGDATGCSVSGATLTASSAGTCRVTATKAGDSQYAAETSPEATVTFAKTARTLSFGRPASVTLEFGAAETFVATPSAGVGDGTVTYTVSGSGCTVTDASTRLIRIDASTGSCVVSASVPEGDDHLAATAEVTIVRTRRAITITGGSPGVNFGTSYTPTALDNAKRLVGTQAAVDSALTKYTFAGTQGTVYGPSSTPPVDAGTYSVLPSDLVITGGSVSDYDITYVAGTLVISRVTRTVAFTTVAVQSAVQYGDTTTVVAAPSVGDGTVVYAVSGASDACTVGAASGVVTVTSASGTCEVEAKVTGGTNHLDATTTTSVTVMVSARPITVTAADRTVTFGTAVASGFSVTTGSLAGTDRISAVTFTYEGTGSTTYVSSTTAPTAIGTYSVTPSVAVFGSGSTADYTIVYAAGTLSIVAPPPPPPPAPAGEPDDGFGTTSSNDSTSSGGSGAPNAGGTGTSTTSATSGGSGTSGTSGTGQTDVRTASSVDPDAPAGATVGGTPVDLVVTPSDSGGLSYTVGSVQLDLRTDTTADGSVRSGTSSGSPELVIPRGETLSVSGGGLAPGSSVQLWSPGDGSQPTELARITVGADGTFVFDLGVGSGTSQMPIGRQVLEIVGFDEDGNQVVVTMTVEVAQGEPAPEADRLTGGWPALAAGQFSATSGGITEAVSMTGLPGRMGMMVEGAGWTMTVEVVRGDGAALNTGANTMLRLDRLSVGTATGVGFLPETLVTVWMFSEPVRLATVSVDGDGGFTLEFLVNTTTIAPGEHTLQVQGVGQDGLIKAVNLGVVVEPLETVIVDVARGGAPWNGRPLFWWFLAVLLLAAGATVAARRQVVTG